MKTEYIIVTEEWFNTHKNAYPINVAMGKDGAIYTAANTRNQFPNLFNGNEIIVKKDETDFIKDSSIEIFI